MSNGAASLVIAIVFHQLFEGLSLGIRIAGLPSKHSEGTLPGPLALSRVLNHPLADGFKHLSGRTLKPLLAVTFAITTPLGIGIGLAALGGASSTGRACSPLSTSLTPRRSDSGFDVQRG